MGYELKCVLQRELDWSSDPVWMCLYFINKNLCRCNPVKMRLYWSRVSPKYPAWLVSFFFNGNFRDRAHQEDSMWSWRQSWEFRCLQLRRCCQKHREVWEGSCPGGFERLWSSWHPDFGLPKLWREYTSLVWSN